MAVPCCPCEGTAVLDLFARHTSGPAHRRVQLVGARDAAPHLDIGKPAKLSVILASIVVASVPFGAAFEFGAYDKHFYVSLSQLATTALVLHLAASRFLTGEGQILDNRSLRAILLCAALLALSVPYAFDRGSAAAAYINFITGVLGGVCVGAVWARTQRASLGPIDMAVVVLVLWGAAQLLVAVGSVGDTAVQHQAAATPWGKSNYVGGVLAACSWILVARLRSLGRRHAWLLLVIGMGLYAAVQVYSRGTALAIAMGVAGYLWSVGKSGLARVFARALTVALPFLALFALSEITAVRLQGNSAALNNIDTRFQLFEEAWREFVGSPVVGTGWASLRQAQVGVNGEEQSFAHNVLLSFPQIGGLLLGLPFLAVLLTLALLAVRLDREGMRAAILACLVISMTDPFFEGQVGALIGLAVIVRVIAGVSDGRGIERDAMQDRRAAIVQGGGLVASRGPDTPWPPTPRRLFHADDETDRMQRAHSVDAARRQTP